MIVVQVRDEDKVYIGEGVGVDSARNSAKEGHAGGEHGVGQHAQPGHLHQHGGVSEEGDVRWHSNRVWVDAPMAPILTGNGAIAAVNGVAGRSA